MTTWMRKFALVFCSLSLIVLAGGCGMDHSPLAGGETTVAAKPIPPTGRTVSALFDASGGSFQVFESNGSGPKDNLLVEFVVPKNALNQPETITMTVNGETLSELAIEFQPGGLEFNTGAELTVRVGAGLVDVQQVESLQVYHRYEDGTVEESIVHVNEPNSHQQSVSIYVVIPGFSRYSMGP